MRTTLFARRCSPSSKLRIHEMVERGEALTGESLPPCTWVAAQVLRHDQGVVQVATRTGRSAYIPHFYFNFYVYQYAQHDRRHDARGGHHRQQGGEVGQGSRRRDAYLKMLKPARRSIRWNCSRTPGGHDHLAAVRRAIREMNRIMDEIEAIYARQKQ